MNRRVSPSSKRGLDSIFPLSRRELIRSLVLSAFAAPAFFGNPARAQEPPQTQDAPDEGISWVCPMHSDYTSPVPGKCPLCGMTLVQARPFDVRDYSLEFRTDPPIVRAGQKTTLLLKVFRPGSGDPVNSFEWVHTKQWHLFVVSQDMEFFEHIHPVMAPDGTWSIDVTLPKPGYYEVLSDFFPSEGAAQFLAHPLVTAGYVGDLVADSAHLIPDPVPITKTVDDLTVRVSYDPPTFIAGQLSRINFHLTDTTTGLPVTDLQTYLGAFGHALMMSEDMVDYVHVHPVNIVPGSTEDGAPPIFLISPDADLDKIRGGPDVTLEALFPRASRYRVWMQMQRHDEVHTFVVTLSVDESRSG
jgi:hypothetical protein